MKYTISLVYEIQLGSMAQPGVMVALRCFTDVELLWQYAKTWLPWQQGSVTVVFELYHYIARPLKPPTLVQESGTYLLYRPSYSQFSVKMLNFPLQSQKRYIEDKL